MIPAMATMFAAYAIWRISDRGTDPTATDFSKAIGVLALLAILALTAWVWHLAAEVGDAFYGIDNYLQ